MIFLGVRKGGGEYGFYPPWRLPELLAQKSDDAHLPPWGGQSEGRRAQLTPPVFQVSREKPRHFRSWALQHKTVTRLEGGAGVGLPVHPSTSCPWPGWRRWGWGLASRSPVVVIP